MTHEVLLSTTAWYTSCHIVDFFTWYRLAELEPDEQTARRDDSADGPEDQRDPYTLCAFQDSTGRDKDAGT